MFSSIAMTAETLPWQTLLTFALVQNGHPLDINTITSPTMETSSLICPEQFDFPQCLARASHLSPNPEPILDILVFIIRLLEDLFAGNFAAVWAEGMPAYLAFGLFFCTIIQAGIAFACALHACTALFYLILTVIAKLFRTAWRTYLWVVEDYCTPEELQIRSFTLDVAAFSLTAMGILSFLSFTALTLCFPRAAQSDGYVLLWLVSGIFFAFSSFGFITLIGITEREHTIFSRFGGRVLSAVWSLICWTAWLSGLLLMAAFDAVHVHAIVLPLWPMLWAQPICRCLAPLGALTLIGLLNYLYFITFVPGPEPLNRKARRSLLQKLKAEARKRYSERNDRLRAYAAIKDLVNALAHRFEQKGLQRPSVEQGLTGLDGCLVDVSEAFCSLYREVDASTSKVARSREQRKQLQTDCDSLRKDKNDDIARITKLEADALSAQTKLTKLTTEKENIETTLKNTQDTLRDVGGEVAEKQATISKLEEQLELVSLKDVPAPEKVNQLTEEVARLTQRLVDLKIDAKASKENFEEANKLAGQAVREREQLRAEVSGLNREVKKLQQALEGAKSNKDVNSQAEATQRQQLQSARSQIENLKKGKQEAEDECGRLRNAAVTQKHDVKDWVERVTELESEKAELTRRIDGDAQTHQQQLESQENVIRGKDDELRKAAEDRKSLEVDVQRLRDEITGLQREKQSLHGQLAQKDADIGKLNADVSREQEVVDRLMKGMSRKQGELTQAGLDYTKVVKQSKEHHDTICERDREVKDLTQDNNKLQSALDEAETLVHTSAANASRLQRELEDLRAQTDAIIENLNTTVSRIHNRMLTRNGTIIFLQAELEKSRIDAIWERVPMRLTINELQAKLKKIEDDRVKEEQTRVARIQELEAFDRDNWSGLHGIVGHALRERILVNKIKLGQTALDHQISECRNTVEDAWKETESFRDFICQTGMIHTWCEHNHLAPLDLAASIMPFNGPLVTPNTNVAGSDSPSSTPPGKHGHDDSSAPSPAIGTEKLSNESNGDANMLPDDSMKSNLRGSSLPTGIDGGAAESQHVATSSPNEGDVAAAVNPTVAVSGATELVGSESASRERTFVIPWKAPSASSDIDSPFATTREDSDMLFYRGDRNLATKIHYPRVTLPPARDHARAQEFAPAPVQTTLSDDQITQIHEFEGRAEYREQGVEGFTGLRPPFANVLYSKIDSNGVPVVGCPFPNHKHRAEDCHFLSLLRRDRQKPVGGMAYKLGHPIVRLPG